MNCPYVTLNVRRNATQATIRKAYRKAAMKEHPDRNPGDDGARDRFRAVQDAFDLLSDPDRRRRYDETGASDVPRSTADAELVGCLSHFVTKAINAHKSGFGSGLKRTDVVAKMQAYMKAEIEAAERSLADAEKEHALLTDAMGRFTVSDGENLLAGVVRAQVAGFVAQVDGLRKQVGVLKRTHDYLRKCAYRVDGDGGSKTPYSDGLTAMMNTIDMKRLGGW